MQHARAILNHWKQGWPDALACACAATLAWLVAQKLFGHAQPIFASVAAVVCLAPGIPSRAGQAINMMLGLVTGIIVGEVVLALSPPVDAAFLIPLVVFFSIMAAICFGMLPVIAIQGGVSALLVLALGPAAAGAPRFLDALAGTAIGLIFSQLLMTPDPARLIESAAASLLRDIAAPLAQLADAVDRADIDQARAARGRLIAASGAVTLLQVRIDAAAGIVRWSLRGWLRRKAARDLTQLNKTRAIVLHAAAMVLADAIVDKLPDAPRAPQPLAARIRNAASVLEEMADHKFAGPRVAPSPCAEGGWRICLESLEALERLTQALDAAHEAPQRRMRNVA